MIDELKKSLIQAQGMAGDDKHPDKKKIDAFKEWFKTTVDANAFSKVDIKLEGDQRKVLAKKAFKANEAVLTVNFDKGAVGLVHAAQRCAINRALETNQVLKNEFIKTLNA